MTLLLRYIMKCVIRLAWSEMQLLMELFDCKAYFITYNKFLLFSRIIHNNDPNYALESLREQCQMLSINYNKIHHQT